jgi:hypothetical protein
MKSFALLAILPCLFGCQEKTSHTRTPTYGNISDALALLDADNREGAYVIAEDPENQNYVQFGIMYSDWIHFDVPSYIDQTKEFEPDHVWNIVTEIPALDGATRRHFIEPTRARALWQYLSDGGFDPYHFRSVYEQQSKAIAATESICFNVPRSDRHTCQLVASKVFEVAHGYPAPVRLKLSSDQTDWVRSPKDNGEQVGDGQSTTQSELDSKGRDKPQPKSEGHSR